MGGVNRDCGDAETPRCNPRGGGERQEAVILRVENSIMRAIDIIRKKRDGGELSRDEIAFVVDGASRESIPDYQLAAWLMAVVWRGMSAAELAALTDAMLHSGEVLTFSSERKRSAGEPGNDFRESGAIVDKHSTGGVGDKTSLVLAPLAAAGGLKVPMISGRGLGHTGGTLDKLESIPGLNVNLPLAEFREVLDACGCAMIGATPEIAPADKRLYALRDVTATVESPYLICASIMSKKLAEGIDGLVLDVKTGDGAFMKQQEDAEHLAKLMVETGERMGKKTVALITDMDQPLGRAIGNALEVEECIEVLNGRGPQDLRELCRELGAWMFVVGGRAVAVEEGKKLAEELIASGAAREKFEEMIRLQGGDARVVDEPRRLPHARRQETVMAARSGYITAIRCEQVGIASMMLGGGRETKDEVIDPAAGITLAKKVGDRVRAGEELFTAHHNHEARHAKAMEILRGCFEIGAEPPQAKPLVRKIIGLSMEARAEATA
jgi:pyrimidine-nucleoside phosphorylase